MGKANVIRVLNDVSNDTPQGKKVLRTIEEISVRRSVDKAVTVINDDVKDKTTTLSQTTKDINNLLTLLKSDALLLTSDDIKKISKAVDEAEKPEMATACREIRGLLLGHEILSRIRAGAKVDSKNPEVQRTLLNLVGKGNSEGVTLMLKVGADVNRMVDGKTALQVAVDKKNASMITELLKAGADPHTVIEGKSILENVLKSESADLIMLFVEAKKIDINKALVFVAQDNKDAVVRELVRKGASFDKAIDLATTSEQVKALVNAGGNINAKDPTTRQTALMKAVKDHNVGKVKALVESGKELDSQDRREAIKLAKASIVHETAAYVARWGLRTEQVNVEYREILKLLEPPTPPTMAFG